MYKKFLEDDTIYLRRLSEKDANNDYYNWMNDSEVNCFMVWWLNPHSIEDIKEYIKLINNDNNNQIFAICTKENDKHIWNIKLWPIDWVNRNSEIAIMIWDKDVWWKWMWTRAIQLVCHHAFNKLNLHKVYAWAYWENIWSIKAFENAGFVKEWERLDMYFANWTYYSQVLIWKLNN